ncbi:dihydrolipoyl dehydrogenase [bacterium]|nr:dihydrolipoyl dehydrogenase [bacterium]
MSDTTQLLVIGGGPGGYAAAFHGADHGLQTTLVDLEQYPGGVCLYRGCIPSKALLHNAKLITDARDAKEHGITFAHPEINLDKLREFKSSVVKKLTGGLGMLTKQRKITYIQGRAKFTSANSVEIELTKGGKQSLSFEHCILASGSRAATIPSFPNDSPHIWNSRTALDLPVIPNKLLIVGGGYIGLEMGSVYSALGSKVSVVEMMDTLLPGCDQDLSRILSKKLQAEFSAIHLSTKVAKVDAGKDGAVVAFEGKHTGEEQFDKILVSVGRKPNVENLGLETTRVQVGADGFISIDAQRRTAEPAIFAIGDCAGQPMLAHKASAEARVAVEAILGKKTEFAPRAIPAVVFTDPEIAWAGLTELDAKTQNREIKILKFPWAASGRALTLGRSDGLTKLICNLEDGKILGAGIAGPHAGDLISEAVLAIEMGAVAEDLALTIHPHPTLSETLMESAEMIFGSSTHYYGKR